jgi:hypothetical protein
MNVSIVMSKNLETTFKTINLCLRRCHSFEQFKQNQTKFSFLQDVEKVKNFLNVYVQHRHYLMCKKTDAQFTIKLNCFECTYRNISATVKFDMALLTLFSL